MRAPVAGGLFAARSATWLGGLALVLGCLAAYLPGLRSLPPLGGDEPRYAEAAREMVVADDWSALVVPQIHGTPRLNKPPLVYWLQAASAFLLSHGDPDQLSYPAALRAEARAQRTVTGSPPTRTAAFAGGIWMYRLPSVLATLLAVLLTWRLGTSMFGPACGWIAAALLGGCFIVAVDARLARTDQILLACTCAAQLSLWQIWRHEHVPLRHVLLFWGAIGLGAMTKGPVTPGVVALTVLALGGVSGRWAWLRRLRWPVGLLVLAGLILPWIAAVAAALGVGPLWQTVGRELWVRTASAESGRAGPPGYHLVLLPALFWPGGLLVVPAAIYAFRRGLRWTRRDAKHEPRAQAGSWRRWLFLRPGRPAELFCIAWIVPAWIVCELAETKLPHYTLPLYPPIALLCARAALAGTAGQLPLVGSRAAVFGDAVWALLGAVLWLAVPVYLAVHSGIRADAGVILALTAGLFLAGVLLIVGFVMVRRRRFVAALMVALGVSIFGSRALFQTVLPNLDTPWVSSLIVRELAELDPEGRHPLAAVDYYRESLLFLTGGRVERIGPAEVGAWLDAHPGGLLISGEHFDPPHEDLQRLATVRGFDHVEGRDVTIRILERIQAHANEPATGPDAAALAEPLGVRR